MGTAPMRLWLVRHARPLIAPGTCYGQLDMAADAEHTQQAACALHQALPPQARLYCSPLQRCRQLRDALLALGPQRPSQASTDARLAEMHFGDWEGRRWDDIDPTALDHWSRHFAHHAPGGGETVAHFMQRVNAALTTLVLEAPAASDVVWITHAGVIRAARLLLQGVPSPLRAEDWPVQAPLPGQWEVVDISRDLHADPTAADGAVGA